MYILGINISHHSSSCLLKDGEVVYFIENDRLTRKKLYGYQEFYKSIGDEDISTPYYPGLKKLLEHTNKLDYIIFTSYGQENVDKEIINCISKKLEEFGVTYKTKIFYHENHHVYHAASGFYGSGFKDAVALVLDGGGSYEKDFYEQRIIEEYGNAFRESESIYKCSYDNGFTPLFKHYSLLECEYKNEYDEIYFVNPNKNHKEIFTHSHSCGDYFNAFCYFMNTGDDSSGKIMGLSSYGHSKHINPPANREDNEEDYLRKSKLLNDEWFYEYNGEWVTAPDISQRLLKIMEILNVEPRINPETLDPNDYTFGQYATLAKRLQDQTEKHTVRLIQKAIDLSGSNNVILSGGYFLNCVNNYKYLKHFPNINFFIDPISNDAGTALGAAKWFYHGITGDKTIRPIKDLYLG